MGFEKLEGRPVVGPPFSLVCGARFHSGSFSLTTIVVSMSATATHMG
jgi:hypothetical protein